MTPTRIVLRDGGTVYVCEPSYKQIRRLIEIARRRGEPKVRINWRAIPLERIAHVETPKEPAR